MHSHWVNSDFVPQITSRLLSLVAAIATLRERIQGAAVTLSWVPAVQKDTRTRNVHACTAIEGNPLTLEQVRALAEGREATTDVRSRREVLNGVAGLRVGAPKLSFCAKPIGVVAESTCSWVSHPELSEFCTHGFRDCARNDRLRVSRRLMDSATAGSYRMLAVRVGKHFPPAAAKVSGLMFEPIEWCTRNSVALSPVLSSAILHYRFEHIHPFADGNGRTGRALALSELYRRGFDSHPIFSVDQYTGKTAAATTLRSRRCAWRVKT